MSRGSLAVVGGGVIGLSVARAAAQAGWRATVYDAGSGATSHVAGGMLAPLSEAWPGEAAALELGVAALRRWPEFAAGLGVDVVTARGTLTVAFDAADATDLRTVAELLTAHGHAAELLDRAHVRAAEPAVGRGVRLGLLAPDELAVDNRMLVRALAAGIEVVDGAVPDLSALPADQVVLAAGHASAQLWPGLPVRPVKGEILRLRARPSSPVAPARTIRARVHGRPVYLVPRTGGIVVGATQYESADTAVTVAGVRDLIADAEAVLPGLGDYELAEAAAGLRPVSPDNVPLIGRLSERVLVATGHGRNGFLLAPLTADAIVAELAGNPLPEAKHADPQRFTEGESWSPRRS